MYVQFFDEERSRIIAHFCGPQPPVEGEVMGEVDEIDPRYVAYVAGTALAVFPEADAARAWRDAEIVRITWLRDRHRDEVEISVETTLTAEQYAELLAYIKALRDWPATAEFPAEESRPVVPEWVASQTQ